MTLSVPRGDTPAPAARPGAAARVRGASQWMVAAVALTSGLCAFVGLSASGWWTDELFTLFLIDHHGGPAEVLRRALTDTQPPDYYLLLYGWSRLFGLGEAALRSLSAILAVAALGVFWWTTRGTLSLAGRTWAVAVAATSPLWFVQSQNIRNYSLCLVLAAVMLGLALRLRRRVRAGCAWPWASWAALTGAGALDAGAHFYGLLGFGALLLALIVSLPSWRLRAALAVSGLLVLSGEAAYVHVLVGHTRENLQHLWFRKDAGSLASVLYDVWKLEVGGAARAAVLGLVLIWAIAWATSAVRHRGRPRPDPRSLAEVDRAWLVGVCAFVLAAMYLSGVVVSVLFAPSLSDRNVLTAAPAAWILLAALYEAALRRLDPPAAAAAGLACGVLLVVHAVAIDRGRVLSRNEPWRDSARYVAALATCRGAPIDVVQPDRFGPDTPFYRLIAQRYLFGRYLGARWPSVRPHLPEAFLSAGRDPQLARRLAVRSRDPASCPVLAWAVHDVDTAQAVALERAIAHLPGVASPQVRLREFFQEHLKGDGWRAQPAGYLIERVQP